MPQTDPNVGQRGHQPKGLPLVGGATPLAASELPAAVRQRMPLSSVSCLKEDGARCGVAGVNHQAEWLLPIRSPQRRLAGEDGLQSVKGCLATAVPLVSLGHL